MSPLSRGSSAAHRRCAPAWRSPPPSPRRSSSASSGTVVWVGITNDRKERLDRRLDEAAGFAIPFLPRGLDEIPKSPNDQDAVITVRHGDQVTSNSNVVLPQMPAGYADTYVNGVRYRVRTVDIRVPEPMSVAVGATYDATIADTNNLHRRVLIICLFAIGAATFAGLAARRVRGPAAETARPADPPDRRRRRSAGRRGARRHRSGRDRRGRQGHAATHLEGAGQHQGGAGVGARLLGGLRARTSHAADRDAHQPRGAGHP